VIIERLHYPERPIAKLEVTHGELRTLSAALKYFAEHHTLAANRSEWFDWTNQMDQIVRGNRDEPSRQTE